MKESRSHQFTNLFWQHVIWDCKLIVRYNILTIAAIITSLYCLLLGLVDTTGTEKLFILVVFSDPVMYGFLFVSVMVLFEKEAGTLNAFAVTPRKTKYYLWSRNASFTLLALLCSFSMLIFANPNYTNYFLFFLAVVLSSSLFVFIGIACITRVQNFNQFIVVIPLVLFPTCLPFLHFLGIWESYWFYLIPTQACLTLFEASVLPINAWGIAYSISYLVLWNYLTYRIALKWYFKFILNSNRHE